MVVMAAHWGIGVKDELTGIEIAMCWNSAMGAMRSAGRDLAVAVFAQNRHPV